MFVLTEAAEQPEKPAESSQTDRWDAKSPYGVIIVGTILLAICALFYAPLFKREWRNKLLQNCAEPEPVPNDRGRDFYQLDAYELQGLVQQPLILQFPVFHFKVSMETFFFCICFLLGYASQ